MSQSPTKTLKDLFGEELADATQAERIDRSTLERWHVCPAQAQAFERGLVKDRSPDAESGNIIHDAISHATKLVYEGHITKPGEFMEAVEVAVLTARPDLQQLAHDGVKYMAYKIGARLLYLPNGEPRNTQDIMAFDGGPDGARGQVAIEWTVDDKPYLLTCELDLLLATASAEAVDLDDYKTGFATWNAEDVVSSFQFGTFYPWLVMAQWPGANRVTVRIINTRKCDISPAVVFDREKFVSAATLRIESAIRTRAQYMAPDAPAAPAWPKPDSCATCAACHLCPEVTGPVRDVATDPAGALRQYIALDAALNSLHKALVAHVDVNGDLGVDGTWFGEGKPKKEAKPSKSLYVLNGPPPLPKGKPKKEAKPSASPLPTPHPVNESDIKY